MPTLYWPKTVWVLQITHKHGDETGVYRSEEGAYKAAHEYVCQWWDDGGPGSDGERMPNSQQDAIDRYFEYMQDCEWYIVEQANLLP